jgi:hypothetical protein
MAGSMFTIKSPLQAPTLFEAANKLGLVEADLDQSFGIVLIDPQQHLYCILVSDNESSVVRPADGTVEGPFSDPKIGTYHI